LLDAGFAGWGGAKWVRECSFAGDPHPTWTGYTQLHKGSSEKRKEIIKEMFTVN